MRTRQPRIAAAGVGGAVMLVALSTLALAQPNVDCKKTETQAECHARLKCKPDEDLEQCQKRLRSQGGAWNDPDDDRGGRGDRGDGGDRGDRGDRGDGGDRGARGARGARGDRGDRGARGDDGGSRRQRGRGRDGGGRRSDGRGFEANKTFGFGFELGEPSGLNGKYFLSDSGALDFGLGYIYSHYYFGDGFHVYGDYLWHPVSLASTSSLELPFYVGVGIRFWDFEYCERIGNVIVCDDGSAMGVRVPLGLSFDFNNAPIDIFVQIVPVIDFVFDDYYDRFRDRNHLAIDASFGVRFWFK